MTIKDLPAGTKFRILDETSPHWARIYVHTKAPDSYCYGASETQEVEIVPRAATKGR